MSASHYRIDGTGGPWVTFITGIANDLTLWDGQTAALAGDFRVLRYDLRGQGNTPATDPCCLLNDKLLAVTRLYTTPLVMVVHPSVAAKDLKDYVALAKAKPDELTYASGGPGAITQMVGELLKANAGTQVREIPYKAIGAELPDLTGGHVLTAYLSPVVIRDFVRSEIQKWGKVVKDAGVTVAQ